MGRLSHGPATGGLHCELPIWRGPLLDHGLYAPQGGSQNHFGDGRATSQSGLVPRKRRNSHLAPDQTRRIDFHYAPPDLQAFRGQRTAVVRICKRDGQPAKGVKVSIGYRDGHYGTIPVFAAPVPESGEIVLKGITDRVSQCLWFHRGYTVKIGEHLRDLGTFKFQTRSAPETFTFLLPPEVGDMAPDIDLVSVTTGKHTKLSNLRGELVCLDFWLSWCPYCQETIEKLDRASAESRPLERPCHRRANQHRRRARQRCAALERARLEALEHYWAGPWKSYPLDRRRAKAFGLDSIRRRSLSAQTAAFCGAAIRSRRSAARTSWSGSRRR